MIQGKIEAMTQKEFITKNGANMFKIGIKVDGAWYNTISKFTEQKYQKGSEVFFETQVEYPSSIVLGTLKVITEHFTPKTGTKSFTGQDILIKALQKENEDLKKQLAAKISRDLDDDIPF